jgi:thioesterase domain-containing protein
MTATAPILLLLHAGPAPTVNLDDSGLTVFTLRVDNLAPDFVTLPGMAREALARLPADATGAGFALAGMGSRASAFAQALALELRGRDRRVACVMLVPDAPQPDAAGVVADRLDAAYAAWTPPEPTLLPVHRMPIGGGDLAEWLVRTARCAPMPPAPAAVTMLPLKIGGPLRAPILCIPGAGASVVSLLDIAQATHPQATVYGMQPRGIDGVAPPCTSVETVADAIAAHVADTLPDGPLRLVGHSFGGWIAFETALRLRAAERTIVSLDLLDSRSPDALGDRHETDELEVLLRWMTLIELSAERSLGLDAETLRPLSSPVRVQRVHQRMSEAGLLPARSDPTSILGVLRMFAACMRTPYTPHGRYDGVLRVVHLRDPSVDADANDREALAMHAGWSRHAPRAQLLCAEGNHMTGIRGAHARALTERLGLSA